ncbi:MAG: FAD-dependent oxidoreductase [Candidatus Eisenbacteria bacterium]
MERLRSTKDLNALRQGLVAGHDSNISTIVITAGTCGQASGANDLIRIAKKELLTRGLADRIHLRITGCHGFCEMEPSVLIEPHNTFYPKLSISDMVRIIEAVAKGKVVKDLLYLEPVTGTRIERQSEIPYYRRQVRTILGRMDKVDPIRIGDAIRSGGYSALAKVLDKGDPGWVIEEVKASGLRGRGGAGFPTGLKWQFLAQQPNGRGKYIVCNADEGDPGAYMDRSVLEGTPHCIIEGMIIGAYATGATEGIVYVRNEYPLAIKHLIIALRQARDHGLLGNDILGSEFSFDIRLVRGAGAFVCGEETAMIASIEGKIGEPRQRPPFPVERGIDGKPTAINNVETWATIQESIRGGAAEFARIGTKGNAGTKIFSLVGKIRNTGLVEVPMGITLSEILFDIGGGPSGSTRIKAVQTGGPSGGCIPAKLFDIRIDYDSLAQAGSILGSGGMIVMDETTCMVDVAKYFTNFLKDESCGKCFTCRKGTQRMHEILDDITKGKSSPEQVDLLEELALAVKDTTMCGLGQTAPNPVLSTLRYFREEYAEHIDDLGCRAAVCKDLVGAPCQATCPVGTEAWRYVAHIARGEYKEAYEAIREPNPFPSVCARVCNHPCESRCRAGTVGGESIAIRALKRFVTDRTDPSVFQPKRLAVCTENSPRVAVVGAGPAGLSAAHHLSLRGYKVTVFDSEEKPGGMLLSAIPAYRLPRDVVAREIKTLLDENVSLKSRMMLGRDFSLNDLFREGFGAVFLALGAHRSRNLEIKGEESTGVLASIEFLKEFNLRGKNLARGRVGVIGGGNSAVDAARVALRQEGVADVTIYYRRTREEMPAFEEEVKAARQEGIALETLVSPLEVLSENGKLAGLRLSRNKLGDMDASGRRRPVQIPDSEFVVPLDTIISAISEEPDLDWLSSEDPEELKTTKWGTLMADPETLATGRPGVFAGGDVIRGPNTVIGAIADGKRAAVMIDRHMREQPLEERPSVKLPSVFVEPVEIPEEVATAKRVEIPHVAAAARRSSFVETEKTLAPERATSEALRCLRCDLEFTRPKCEEQLVAEGGRSA